MSRFLKSSVAGLGALALSCAGVPMDNFPKPFQGIVQDVNMAVDTKDEQAECVKLNAPPSEEEEYTLGGSIALNWVNRGGGLVPLEQNPKLVRYINIVGKNLGAQSSRPLLKWTFGVLQTQDSVNAISAPGGYIFVTRGLLRGVENEAQLAGVLAHEIAHVTGRHVLNHYIETKVSECRHAAQLNGLVKAGKRMTGSLDVSWGKDLLALAKSGGPLDLGQHIELLTGLTDNLVDTISSKGLDEKDEYAADAEAVRLMVSAGYDPQEYLDFLAKLPDNRTVFSHHPRKVDRRKKLVTLLQENQGSQEGFSEFAAGTQGLVQPPLPPEFASMSR